MVKSLGFGVWDRETHTCINLSRILGELRIQDLGFLAECLEFKGCLTE